MSNPHETGADLRCSFCAKSQADVQKMIAGNKGVAICNECVEVCNDILADCAPSSWDESEPVSESDMVSFKCPGCGRQMSMPRKP